MKYYKVLNKQIVEFSSTAIVPIRSEDRYDIMRWRNEQIYHLRQQRPLTESDQNAYFDNVVSKLFEQDQPSQILFSYLENETCIGYGGLVHINWMDKNAEISFIMDTQMEKEFFQKHWTNFLTMIEQVAFEELNLHKVSTYAYDLRPHLYPIFEECRFTQEALLKEHIMFNSEFIDVVIHAKINHNERD